VGRIINGFGETPFALPIVHVEDAGPYGTWTGPRPAPLAIDAALFGEDDLLLIFSYARAYFMVDMEVPSATVHFLCSLMPRKPRAELYNSLGLQKHGKNLFYRDFLAHLRHSSDRFRIAPGIKGMVMLVFDLPSFPYVFKLIKDFYPPPKDTSREQIKGKYQLVKQHDRVGRMADTLEYSVVAFPRQRFEEELIDELRHFCGSLLEEAVQNGVQMIVIKHLYIERRMVPLNMYLQKATPEQLAQAVQEYGNAIKDLVSADIFPGDMLWKNFGVTRHGKVVFYDYDEIEYITECNFRRVPTPRNEEEEMSGEVWYSVGPKDVFPETFAPFLLGNPQVRASFMAHHADLLDPTFWQSHKERIAAGHVHDVFPYDPQKRFVHRRFAAAAPGA
jgi:isocitrate dehydrogenase kinase/phosphatase